MPDHGRTHHPGEGLPQDPESARTPLLPASHGRLIPKPYRGGNGGRRNARGPSGARHRVALRGEMTSARPEPPWVWDGACDSTSREISSCDRTGKVTVLSILQDGKLNWTAAALREFLLVSSRGAARSEVVFGRNRPISGRIRDDSSRSCYPGFLAHVGKVVGSRLWRGILPVKTRPGHGLEARATTTYPT